MGSWLSLLVKFGRVGMFQNFSLQIEGEQGLNACCSMGSLCLGEDDPVLVHHSLSAKGLRKKLVRTTLMSMFS